MTILSILLWLAAGLYGLIFNVSYIDEAKYIIKGWLMLTGQIGYYTTPDFFYQHMPLSLLWPGLSQLPWGPSLLLARLQSFLVGWLVLYFSWLLGKKLGGKTAGLMTLILLGLAPTVAFYYSTATPQSLLILFLLLGFIFLHDRRLSLASVCFTLTFLIRENFLFTLLLYLGYLLVTVRQEFVKQLAVVSLTLSLFLLPGYPGTINVLKNLPGVSRILPVSQAEKQVLNLYWKEDLQTPGLEWRAIRDFGVVFHAWIIIGGFLLIRWLSQKHKYSPDWLFLITVTVFNFIIHTWAAFQLSPRAIISYFPYVAPLAAVIMARELAGIKNKRLWFWGYLVLLVLLPLGLRYGRNFAIPVAWPDLRQINHSAQLLKPLIAGKNKIVWVAEPISLFIAGKVPYYPLINHTGFYKPSSNTATVRALGFWNQAMLGQWLNEADLVVTEDNKLKLLKESRQAQGVAEFLEKKLQENYQLIGKTSAVWPGGLQFYLPRERTIAK